MQGLASPSQGSHPQLHFPATHGFRLPQPSTTSGCFSKGIFWSHLAQSPPCFLLPQPGWRNQLVVPCCPQEAPGAHAGVAWALGRAVGAATRWPWPSGHRPGVRGGVRGTDARPAESPPPGTLPTAPGQIWHHGRGCRAGQAGLPQPVLPAPQPGLCWRGEGSWVKRKKGAAGGHQATDSSQRIKSSGRATASPSAPECAARQLHQPRAWEKA